MRPTGNERRLDRNLPGTVWLPAVPKLTAAWRDVLLNELHTISIEDLTCARCGLTKPCACSEAREPRVCWVCGLPKPCECQLGKPIELTVEHRFGDLELTGVALNGEDVDVGPYILVRNALIAENHPELVPFTAAFVQTITSAIDREQLVRSLNTK